MKRTIFCLLGTIFGYVIGAGFGYALVGQTSGNKHDRPVEAAMTGVFVSGPLGAIVGGIAGFRLGRRRS
jgi:hypothetical protein